MSSLSPEEEDALAQVRSAFQAALLQVPRSGELGGPWTPEDVSKILCFGNASGVTDMTRIYEVSARSI